MARTLNSLKPYQIRGTIIGSASKAYRVKITNMTTKENVSVKAVATDKTTEYEFALDIAEASLNGTKSGYSTNDIIEILVSGAGYAYTTVTITGTGGGSNVGQLTATDHTSTNCPGVTI